MSQLPDSVRQMNELKVIPTATFDRIDREAKAYSDGVFKDNPNGFTIAPYVNSTTLEEAYFAGATREAERSMKLVEAASKYLLSRKVVDKELDWDAFEAFEQAISAYMKAEG